MSPKRDRSNERSDSDENERRVQKPVLEVGQEVMSVWWDYDDDGNANNTSWWPGIVTNVTVNEKKDFGYGPIRHYDIDFDDGDQLSSVPECYVFSREEYYLAIKSLTKKWDAIENIRDEESEDEWAKKVGWYNLSVDGETTESFPLLCDALEAYKRRVKKPKFSTDEDDSSSVDSSFSFVDKSNHHLVCSNCNKSFKSKSGFDYHLDRKVCESGNAQTATTEKLQKMICGFCSKEFKSKLGLAYHVKMKVCRKTCAIPAPNDNLSVEDAEASLGSTFEPFDQETVDAMPDNISITNDSEANYKTSSEATGVKDGSEKTDGTSSVLNEKENDAPQPDLEGPKPPAPAPAVAVRTMPSNMVKLDPNQTQLTKFPVGCNVWINLNLNPNGMLSFQKGTVISVQVCLANGRGEIICDVAAGGSVHQYKDTEIVYAEGSPVLYSPSGLFTADSEQGQVLVCKQSQNPLEYRYAIMLCNYKDSNLFEVIEDVPSKCIKYLSSHL